MNSVIKMHFGVLRSEDSARFTVKLPLERKTLLLLLIMLSAACG